MTIEQRLAELGLDLPAVAKPLAAYVPAVQTGNHIFTSGQLPTVNGKLDEMYKGSVGGAVAKENAKAAARMAILNALAAVKSVAGSLDRVERVVKLVCFVASDRDFTEQPFVANGASELLKEIFGAAGEHARSALGVASLPLGACVEIELIVAVKP
ncbi:MAG: RidA family protein [Rhizobacter sp.]|nr:RidA family protein [Chlorobiales bacterium]